MKSRSLKFAGELGPEPYEATIEVTGGVTGMKYGTLYLTRADLLDLKETVRDLLHMLPKKEKEKVNA